VLVPDSLVIKSRISICIKIVMISVNDEDPSLFPPVLWIRIRILLDPHSFDCLGSDPYWECRSGSRSSETDQHLQINLVFCPLKRLCTVVVVGMLFDLLPTLSTYIFHDKIKVDVTRKFDHDPYPDPPGSALVCLPDPHPDPDQH
jgi:hypothetical protein